MKKLTEKQLNRLTTPRLLALLRSVRARESGVELLYTNPHICCSECMEYAGEDYEKDVAQYVRPYTLYKEKIKGILNVREHLERKKQ